MRTLINSCFDIRSIEVLARLHVMFAQILETSSQESEKHILAAAYCVQKIWQVIYSQFYYVRTIHSILNESPVESGVLKRNRMDWWV